MSFVEVRFQNNPPLRTRAVEGPAPQWNQALVAEFKAPRNDLASPETLSQVTDNVYISLFDEEVHTLIADDRYTDRITTVTERKYLGSLSIPFSTIYMNGQISGMFALDTPPMNLGYEKLPQPGALGRTAKKEAAESK